MYGEVPHIRFCLCLVTGETVLSKIDDLFFHPGLALKAGSG
jgi:hypothetical protein